MSALVSLKTSTLRRIIEVNLNSAMTIEIEDSPNTNPKDDEQAVFAVHCCLELEEGITMRLAPHTAPYLLSAYYTVSEFMKREQSDIASHLASSISHNNNEKVIHTADHPLEDVPSNTIPSQTLTSGKSPGNPSLSESVSVFVCSLLFISLYYIPIYF